MSGATISSRFWQLLVLTALVCHPSSGAAPADGMDERIVREVEVDNQMMLFMEGSNVRQRVPMQDMLDAVEAQRNLKGSKSGKGSKAKKSKGPKSKKGKGSKAKKSKGPKKAKKTKSPGRMTPPMTIMWISPGAMMPGMMPAAMTSMADGDKITAMAPAMGGMTARSMGMMRYRRRTIEDALDTLSIAELDQQDAFGDLVPVRNLKGSKGKGSKAKKSKGPKSKKGKGSKAKKSKGPKKAKKTKSPGRMTPPMTIMWITPGAMMPGMMPAAMTSMADGDKVTAMAPAMGAMTARNKKMMRRRELLPEELQDLEDNEELLW